MLPTAGRYVDGSGMSPSLGGVTDTPSPARHIRTSGLRLAAPLRWPPTREAAMVQPDVLSSPSAAVLRLLTGGWVARAVEVVARLGVADELASGPLPAAELASRTGT